MRRDADAIDQAAGLSENGLIFDLRADRPEFLNGAEDCRKSVLLPQEDLGLSPALRNAIARRVAGSAGMPALLSQYPQPDEQELQALADGGEPTDPLLKAIADHTDMIAQQPKSASRAHLEQLQQAGLSVPQVIALSELLAFVCFQIRVVHGLALLEQNQ